MGQHKSAHRLKWPFSNSAIRAQRRPSDSQDEGRSTLKVFFHIGMGKTGTSSIQRALDANEENLSRQCAKYLGMWFDVIDPAFSRYEGLAAFFQQPEPELREAAHHLFFVLQNMQQAEGCERFIFSNEGIFGYAQKAAPFFEELCTLLDTEILLYLRDPRTWLPSAYTQWGLHHKQAQGPVQPYAAQAPTLIKTYNAVEAWHATFPENLRPRVYRKGIDIVGDFADATGLTLETSAKRHLERGESAEILLRGLFNARYTEEARPELFNRTVLNTHKVRPREISASIDEWFDFAETDNIVSQNIDIFEKIKNQLGIDLLAEPYTPSESVDKDVIKDRLMDYLSEIVLSQAIKIKRMEKDIADLKEGAGGLAPQVAVGE